MKKLLTSLVALTLLTGCAGGRLVNPFTTSVTNPVSNETLAGAIAAYGVADSALIAYRGLPRCTVTNNFSLGNICWKRSLLVKGQELDRKANLAVNSAVNYQRNNPTLNASSYIQAAVDAVNLFKAFTVDNGLPGAI